MTEKSGTTGAPQDSAPGEQAGLTPEQQEQAFAKGFDKGIAEYDIGTPVKTPEAAAGDEQHSAAAPASTGGTDQSTGKQTELTPEQKALAKRVRKMEGTVGAILERLDTIANQAATAKPAAGDDSAKGGEAAAVASLKHIEELEQIIGERGQFRELAPIKRELEDIRAQLASLNGGGNQQQIDQANIDIGEIVARATEIATLNVKHPDWKEKTAKPEFLQFALAGGPDTAEYDEYRALLRDPKTEAQADRMSAAWAEEHPDWWKDKGRLFFSDSATDSIAMLDQFELLNRKKSEFQGHQQRQERRLHRAAVPDGTTETPAAGVNDEEAFVRGFKRGMSSYGGLRR